MLIILLWKKTPSAGYATTITEWIHCKRLAVKTSYTSRNECPSGALAQLLDTAAMPLTKAYAVLSIMN